MPKNPYYFPASQSQLEHGDAHYPGTEATVDEVMSVIAHGGLDRDGLSQEQWLEALRESGTMDKIIVLISQQYYEPKYQQFITMMERTILECLE